MAIELKDGKGKGLIKKLCCPRNPTKTNPLKRLTPQTDPLLFGELYEYNIQDIVSEASISQVIPDLSPIELEVWKLDQRINVRGVQIDTKGLNDCLIVVRKTTAKYAAELKQITGIPSMTVDTLAQLSGWMAGKGVVTPSLDKDHVKALLKRDDLLPDVQRVLEIRQTLGSASVKKLYALERYVCSDGRIRGLYIYCGARQTGRWSGTGPQPQNIPSGGPDVYQCPDCNRYYWVGIKNQCPSCGEGNLLEETTDWCVEAAQTALLDIATHDIDLIEARWGNALKAVSGCLRALFVAAEGHDLICSDYSAIEAVVAAGIAGEDWRLEVFRTHGKIYEMSASKTSGIPFEEFMAYKKRTGKHHPLRKTIGKVGELGSQFGGWVNAWKNFGADKFMSDEEIKQAILAWRAESPTIVECWGGQMRKHPTRWEFTPELYGLEGAAILAIKNPGTNYSYRSITYGVVKDILYCKLPSGRHLIYHKPRLKPTINPMGNQILGLSFEGWNSDSTKGPIGWARRDTYGPRLFENCVQATARDLFAYGMLQLDKAGYPIVLHSHDEPVMEVLKGFGSIEEVERLMGVLPSWCKWPIKAAGGWRGFRYRK